MDDDTDGTEPPGGEAGTEDNGTYDEEESAHRALTAVMESLETGVGRYRIQEPLGSGGEADVYRALEEDADRPVALKILKREFRDDPELVRQFQLAAERMSRLDHGNIVRVLERSRINDDPPYCALQLVTGGTLADPPRQERFRKPERAAKLMIKIAHAVEHAHQHGVLHGDLSPSNVLMDLNDEPYVADFLARRIGQANPPFKMGRFNYMAPEQAAGQGGTVAADVYGLGAILFELLTGRAPIQAESFDEVVSRFERGEASSPRKILRDIPSDIDAVCRTALRRDPGSRYRSAASFADSLWRATNAWPLLQPPTPRRRRLRLWATRHPLLAVGAALGAILLLVADIGTLRSVRSEEAQLATTLLHSNAALANAQARAVLTLFEKLVAQASRAATDPEIRDFMRSPHVTTRLPALERLLERARSFDSASVLKLDGTLLARYPNPVPAILGKDFSFRRYHRCVRALIDKPADAQTASEPEVCISPAYRGEAIRGIEFTLTAPVYDESGAPNGYLALNRHARRTLEEIEIGDAYESGQTTALFGERDRDRLSPAPSTSASKKLTAVAHPALFDTEEYALDAALSRRLLARFGEEGLPGEQLVPKQVRPLEDPDYVDPVTLDHRLAGFAPVGPTGYVVAVSTPRDQAMAANQSHRQALSLYAALLNLGFVILGLVAVWGSLRETPPPRRPPTPGNT